MQEFEYVRPGTLAEAIAVAGLPDTSVVAGGTNLIDLMKVGVMRPRRLVDITAIPGLDEIEFLPDGEVRIGALVRNADLANDTRFRSAFPSIAEALLSGASAQLRNAATVGGNVLQRTRCSYFFDLASACNKREPGAGCDAPHGEPAYHAVLGWSTECIATHPSDFCVPLAALDAEVEVEGPDGQRRVPLDEFHRLPGDAPHLETMLCPGELIVALRLPAGAAAFARHSRYLKLRERTSFAFALVSVAASLAIEDNVITDARIALGGVALRPWRARDAEARLRGESPGDAVFRDVAALALSEGRAPDGGTVKIELARRLVVRALQAALAGAPEQMPALPGSVFATNASAGDE